MFIKSNVFHDILHLRIFLAITPKVQVNKAFLFFFFFKIQSVYVIGVLSDIFISLSKIIVTRPIDEVNTFSTPGRVNINSSS